MRTYKKTKALQDQIIDLLEKHPQGLTNSDIAKKLGKPRRSVNLITLSLYTAGFLDRRSLNKLSYLYSIGDAELKEIPKFSRDSIESHDRNENAVIKINEYTTYYGPRNRSPELRKMQYGIGAVASQMMEMAA